jgi:hypothetical protein
LILDQVELYGVEWLEDTWKQIQEDKKEHFELMASLFPLAKSPMGKEDAKTLQRYAREVERMLDSLTPWKGNQRSKALREKVGSGNIVVQMGPGDLPGDPLYKDAKIMRS